MESMSELRDAWQIQILVLLSFMLQVFLFFTGSIRHHNTNIFLRALLWIAYLGADSVAVYILGILSRQQEDPTGNKLSEIHPLAFIWAPFLLVHLGGQDTITAFAMEDNNLWLRHFLNLVVQVALALYVFWKSTVWRTMHLLVTGAFVFLAGAVKYGERTMALKYGTLKSLESFTADHNNLPEIQQNDSSPQDRYSADQVVGTALHSVFGVRDIFAGRTTLQMDNLHRNAFKKFRHLKHRDDLSFKGLEIELKLMYDDLYTKAMVLRTRTGIIVRCISQVSMVVALVLFLTIWDKQYSKADMAITYTLFLGGICLEVCAAFKMVTSAWTWGWLEASKKRPWLASIWCRLISSRITVLPEKKTLWSNSMGQYHLVSYARLYNGKSKWWKFVGVGQGVLFWFSKLLDSTVVPVDKQITELISKRVTHCCSTPQKEFIRLSGLLSKIDEDFGDDFGGILVFLHMFTVAQLSSASISKDKVDVCQKLSNYMLYLFVNHPEMLPAKGSTEATLQKFLEAMGATDGRINFHGNKGIDVLIDKAREALKTSWGISEIQPCDESLVLEIEDLWIRLMMYAAGRSRPEMHAAHLARGGELLTFVWLLMLHHGVGDSATKRIELYGNRGDDAYLIHADDDAKRR